MSGSAKEPVDWAIGGCPSDFAVERRAHAHSQLRLGYRFLQEVDTLIETALMDDGVPGIAGHIQNPYPRAKMLGFPRQLATVPARHDDVGEQQIDWSLGSQEFEGSVGVRRSDDAIVQTPQYVARYARTSVSSSTTKITSARSAPMTA